MISKSFLEFNFDLKVYKMASTEVLQRLEGRASTAEQMISLLKLQIAQIKSASSAGSFDDQVNGAYVNDVMQTPLYPANNI